MAGWVVAARAMAESTVAAVVVVETEAVRREAASVGEAAFPVAPQVMGVRARVGEGEPPEAVRWERAAGDAVEGSEERMAMSAVVAPMVAAALAGSEASLEASQPLRCPRW